METNDIVLLAVTLVILGEVSYLLAKLPKTSIKSKSRAILVDTSVIMDGRITGLAATGFIGGTLVIPRSVIGELQFLADNADADKRARARNGLDVVSELQRMDGIDVEILQDGSKAEEGVDERLLTLAKRHNALICTLDYNLNKVAVVEGIQVLNINELAQSLRMSHLPGEHMLIELQQKGQDSHQGVGYLPDGTMVVVEQSSSLIGQTVEVEVTRSLQTAAGKMMFAKRTDKKQPSVTRKQHGTGRAPANKPATRQEQAVKEAKVETKPAATVYHARPQRKQKPAKQDAASTGARPQTQPEQAQKPQQKQTAPTKKDGQPAGRPKSSRRPTQKDREAAFINLIDKQ